MSIDPECVYFYSKATAVETPSGTQWQFDTSEQPGAPHCIPDEFGATFIDGDILLEIDDEDTTVTLGGPYFPGTEIVAVSSFDSNDVEPDCVAGTNQSSVSLDEWLFYAGADPAEPLPNNMCPEEPAETQVIRVATDGDAGADGSTWLLATTLPHALELAADETPLTELWLKSGTYDASTDGTYEVPRGARLYGGFAGTETQRSERNPDAATNTTVCDGGATARVFRVVPHNDDNTPSIDVSDLVVFDGLSILHGFGGTQAPHTNPLGGGAILFDAEGVQVIVRNSILSENVDGVDGAAAGGGAINNSNGDGISGDVSVDFLVLCDCVLENNIAYGQPGGGAVCLRGSEEFHSHFRSYNVTYNSNSNPFDFQDPMDSSFGGAVCLLNIQDSLLINCVFFNNEAPSAGAFGVTQLIDHHPSTLIQCTFVSNSASIAAGAVSASAIGDAFFPGSAGNVTMNVRNCIFYDNTDATSVSLAGPALDLLVNAVALQGMSAPVSTVTVCTYMASGSDADSFEENSSGGGTTSLTLSDSHGNGVDPLFVNIGTGDLRLTAPSPARNTGNNDALDFQDCANTIALGVDVNVDRARISRVIQTIVDIGAYEYAPVVDCVEVLMCWNGEGPQPCVHGDTLLEVQGVGRVPIKDIVSGDVVQAHDGTWHAVATNYRMFCKGSRFVHYEKDALGAGKPAEPLLVRCGHPLLVDGEEVRCDDLINKTTVRIVQCPEVESVYTLATETPVFVTVQAGMYMKTWTEAGFDHYTKHNEIGKRLIYQRL